MTDPGEYMAVVEREWSDGSSDYVRNAVTGGLAVRVREKVGAAEDAPVWIVEKETVDGGCPTCYWTQYSFTVECGNHIRTFDGQFADNLDDLIEWLDRDEEAIRLAAEARLEDEAHQRNQALIADDAQITGLVGILDQLNRAGVNDRDWHDALEAALKGQA